MIAIVFVLCAFAALHALATWACYHELKRRADIYDQAIRAIRKTLAENSLPFRSLPPAPPAECWDGQCQS